MSCDEIPVGKSLNTTVPNIQDDTGDLFERMEFMGSWIEKYKVKLSLQRLLSKKILEKEENRRFRRINRISASKNADETPALENQKRKSENETLQGIGRRDELLVGFHRMDCARN